jgi:hypothetical protein
LSIGHRIWRRRAVKRIEAQLRAVWNSFICTD